MPDAPPLGSFQKTSPLLHTKVGQEEKVQGTRTDPERTTYTCLTCVCAHVPLQVEGVVEALAAEGAQVPLHLVVALEVTGEHALQAETLAAEVTAVEYRVLARARGELGRGNTEKL